MMILTETKLKYCDALSIYTDQWTILPYAPSPNDHCCSKVKPPLAPPQHMPSEKCTNNAK